MAVRILPGRLVILKNDIRYLILFYSTDAIKTNIIWLLEIQENTKRKLFDGESIARCFTLGT